MSNVINNSPFIRTSRSFPQEADKLSKEVDQTYVDVANAVNQRTIGIYATTKPSVTGNGYFISGQRQQSLRQLYTFGAIAAGATLNIPILKYLSPYVHIYGVALTTSNSLPLPYASTTANGNIELLVVSGASPVIRIIVGSASPAIVSGYVVIEWLSNP
jgi:hypothetical protein